MVWTQKFWVILSYSTPGIILYLHKIFYLHKTFYLHKIFYLHVILYTHVIQKLHCISILGRHLRIKKEKQVGPTPESNFILMCDSIYPDSTCPHLIFQHLKDLNHLPDTFRTTFRYPINILQIPIKYSHNIRYVWRFLFVKVRWGFLFLFLFFLSFLGGKQSQLLLRPTIVGLGLQVHSGVWHLSRAELCQA